MLEILRSLVMSDPRSAAAGCGCACACHGQHGNGTSQFAGASTVNTVCRTATFTSSCDTRAVGATSSSQVCCGLPVSGAPAEALPATGGAASRPAPAVASAHVGGGLGGHSSVRAKDHDRVVERPDPYYGRVRSITEMPTAFGGVYDPSALKRSLAVPGHATLLAAKQTRQSKPAPKPIPAQLPVRPARKVKTRKVKTRRVKKSRPVATQGTCAVPDAIWSLLVLTPRLPRCLMCQHRNHHPLLLRTVLKTPCGTCPPPRFFA